MPAKLRTPDTKFAAGDFLEFNEHLWEYKRELTGMSPIRQIVLENVGTGYETTFPATAVESKSKRVRVMNLRPADSPVSVECLIAESRACRSQWAVRPPV